MNDDADVPEGFVTRRQLINALLAGLLEVAPGLPQMIGFTVAFDGLQVGAATWQEMAELLYNEAGSWTTLLIRTPVRSDTGAVLEAWQDLSDSAPELVTTRGDAIELAPFCGEMEPDVGGLPISPKGKANA